MNTKTTRYTELALANYWQKSALQEFKCNDGSAFILEFPGYFALHSNLKFSKARLNFNGEPIFCDILIQPSNLSSEDSGENLHKIQINSAAIQSYILIPPSHLDSAAHKSSAKDELAGSCGLYLSSLKEDAKRHLDAQTKLMQIVNNLGMQRTNNKIKPFLAAEPSAQMLYEKMMESFGQTKFSKAFLALAQEFKLKDVMQCFEHETPTNAALQIICTWLNITGLAESIPANIFNADQLKYIQSSPSRNRLKPDLKGINPKGHPVLRLLGMLQVLYNCRNEGLLLTFLHAWQKLAIDPNRLHATKSNINNVIDIHFQAVPEVSFLSKNYSGRQRLAVINANALLPFFIAWARKSMDEDLSSFLYKVYWSLSGELSTNSTIRTMEQRLGNNLTSKKHQKTIAYAQGMIQMRQDVCLTFDNNCKNCALKQWLAS